MLKEQLWVQNYTSVSLHTLLAAAEIRKCDMYARSHMSS